MDLTPRCKIFSDFENEEPRRKRTRYQVPNVLLADLRSSSQFSDFAPKAGESDPT